jgi:ketosteroid isomerase-like protein
VAGGAHVPPEEVNWEEEIRGCEREWMQAVKDHNMSAVEEFLGEEFEMVSSSLGFADRAEYLQAAREYELEEFQVLDANVDVHGDWAIVHCMYTQKARLRGRDVSHDFFFTDVWIFRDGRWQVVTRHSSTPAPEAWEQAKGRVSARRVG